MPMPRCWLETLMQEMIQTPTKPATLLIITHQEETKAILTVQVVVNVPLGF